jgi:diguanylate cyclase (GGDEF)-like protein
MLQKTSDRSSLLASSPLTSLQDTAQIAPDLCEAWLECREAYLKRIAIIEQAINALHSGHLVTQLRQQAEQEAHTLIGSLGSFGLNDASCLLRQIQQILRQDIGLGSADAIRLQRLLEGLQQAMLPEPPLEIESKLPDPLALPSFSSSFPTLLIIDDDPILATLLATEALPWGIQAQIASNLTQARQQILQQVPNVILLDLTLSRSGESGLDFLKELQNSYPALPVLVFTASDGLSDRVQAARLGCRGFFQKPIVPTQVLAGIVQTLQQVQQDRSKLLIVDDDPQLLTLLHQMLATQGYDVTSLRDAQQFWEVLEQSSPDLLILDIELQGCVTPAISSELNLNGFDLCQIIRNDPHWNKLPILFLSASTDTKTMQCGFEVGADDFLHKPIVPLDLFTRVRKRLEQGQLRQQTELDELTRVSNRRKSLQDLTRLLRLAQRQQKQLSLAILDLDHFKRINDLYGHEMGDQVLNYFGNLLKQSFRQEDVVGRWGGEEFVVGLYGMSKLDGAKRLTEVLQAFRQASFTTRDGRTFQVTFSGGIAQFCDDGTDLQGLYHAADQALYQAKAQGRNQILEATDQE